MYLMRYQWMVIIGLSHRLLQIFILVRGGEGDILLEEKLILVILDGTDLVSAVVARDLEDRLVDVVLEQSEDDLVADPVMVDKMLLAFIRLI